MGRRNSPIKRMKKRFKKKLYKKHIGDAALDVSCDSAFRERLAEAEYGQRFEISPKTAAHTDIFGNVFERGLVYFVEKVSRCPESFDDGLVIFKFTAKDFPEVAAYTGNALK